MEMEWQFSSIAPGVYAFGSAPFSGMPSVFAVAPYVHIQKNNEGEPFCETVTTTGVTIADRYVGPAPVMTVTVIER